MTTIQALASDTRNLLQETPLDGDFIARVRAAFYGANPEGVLFQHVETQPGPVDQAARGPLVSGNPLVKAARFL